MEPESSDKMAFEALAIQLADSACGSWEREAATRLLIEHGYWLRSESFREYIHAGVTESGQAALPWIAWNDLGRDLKSGLISGSSEEEILVLKVSVSFTGYFSVALREIENVHPRTMRAIMRSMATLAGYGQLVDSWCQLDDDAF